MRFLPESEDVSAAVIGLGNVGSCVAGALAERGVRVVGVDTDARLTRELAERHCRFSEPGMNRELVVPLLERSGLTCGVDFGLAFCPERLSEGAALRELRSFPIVVGGWCADSAAAAEAFWRRGVGVDIIQCSSMEAAEMVKLADNWWIDHNIALANDLAKVCGAIGVDVLDVISAANSIPKGNGNVNILTPSVGVGGSCLTKDPWMVWRSARNRGIDLPTIPAASGVNDDMPRYTTDLIRAELDASGKQLDGARVAVLGWPCWPSIECSTRSTSQRGSMRRSGRRYGTSTWTVAAIE
ncbi:nucleotide sugar dehydrogenase [Salinispora vitiensis]|uniref:hypothetical protein n=1 Tax=Salinispora vitiensis TaxID=999544 RepID=UPI0003673361|nr:hypothetical protein [Salinispora vitiensis]